MLQTNYRTFAYITLICLTSAGLLAQNYTGQGLFLSAAESALTSNSISDTILKTATGGEEPTSPPTRFVSGERQDEVQAMTTDGRGFLYLTGMTTSPVEGLDGACFINGCAYLTKLNERDLTEEYTLYFGGSGRTRPARSRWTARATFT